MYFETVISIQAFRMSIGERSSRINKGSHHLVICIHIVTIPCTVYIMYQKRKHVGVLFPLETENMALEGNANFTQNPRIHQVNY